MGKAIRTFIAVKIKPGDNLLRVAHSLKQSLAKETVRWVVPENWHITLKFLGEIPEPVIVQIAAELEKLAAVTNTFKFRLQGIGFFKSKGMPRVLFVNCVESDSLKLLFNQLENVLVKFGVERETRRFIPHFTIARIDSLNDKEQFYQAVAEFEESEFQEVNVSEIVFFQSVLKPAGPVYIPLKTAKLKNL